MILSALEPASRQAFARSIVELGEVSERPAAAVLGALVGAASIGADGRPPSA